MTVSISSLEQTQELLRLRTDWHRLIHLRRVPSAANFSAFTDRGHWFSMMGTVLPFEIITYAI